ncbi:hypothetical protein ACLMNI_000938 [Campylobacter upsaliensis]
MRKILLQILCFSFIFMGIFIISRFLSLQSLSGENEGSFMVYLYGLGHDMRTFSAAFLPLFLCAILAQFSGLLKKWGGGGVNP